MPGQIGKLFVIIGDIQCHRFLIAIKNRTCAVQEMAAWAAGTALRHATAISVFFSAGFIFCIFSALCFFTFFCRDIQTIAGVYNVTSPDDRAAATVVPGPDVPGCPPHTVSGRPSRHSGFHPDSPAQPARPLSATIPSSRPFAFVTLAPKGG